MATYQVYTKVTGEKAILCKKCGLISVYPNDIEKLYCSHCKEFHKTINKNLKLKLNKYDKH